MKLFPTILCGGTGSRLWPVSRDMHPKPFIRLADGQSLLQKSWLRGAALPGVSEILTVTNREFFFEIEDEYRKVAALPKKDVANSSILEPFGRSTAPAIAAAALHVAGVHGDDALLLVLAADHLIGDQAAFAAAVARGTALAASGKLVTFGIPPTAPETGYGYIEASGDKVLRFVEKPTLEKAREYLASGRYLWNAGMFCFTAGALLREMELHCPELLAAVRACLKDSRRAQGKGFTQIDLNPEAFSRVPEASLDYAVMEKSRNVAVVPCRMGWSDIGSWSALGALTEPDAAGNRVQGEALLHDVTNCYVQTDGRIIAAVGVKDLVIIDTPDALLVADRERTQEVKNLYATLKTQGHATYKRHRTVNRPWGTYTILEEGPRFKIRRLEVRPGGALSLQMHQHRAEHWVVVQGEATVVNGEREYVLKADESTCVPAKNRHRLSNKGAAPLIIIEVQNGDYIGEDDIVRL
ncbi:MAG: mannose-1-phosphate guanylyltransferase/mannose-6-phosphate isomerase [Elusimicrobiota bacterium]